MGETPLAHFITSAPYPQFGTQGLIANPAGRRVTIQGLCDKVDAKITELCMTTRFNDVVPVTQADDGADAVVLGMAVAPSGSISNAGTLRAWTSAKFVGIAKKAGSLTGAYTLPGS